MLTSFFSFRTFVLCLLLALLTCQCATYDFSRPIRQQGNLIPDAKLARLKLGMSKENVAILMGTSLLSPVFNDDRWDYAFTRRVRGHARISKHVVLYFSGDRLVRIER